MCELIGGLGFVKRGSDELLEICENYIIKHRKALLEHDIDVTRQGFKALEKGSHVLFEILGEPVRDLPRIEHTQ
jgi:hypothetical protein